MTFAALLWLSGHLTFLFSFIVREKIYFYYVSFFIILTAIYSNYPSHDLSIYISYFREPGVYEYGFKNISLIFSKIIHPMGVYYLWVIVFLSIPFLSFKYLFNNVEEYKHLTKPAFIIFIASVFFGLAITNNLRQSLSIMIILLGVILIFRKNYISGYSLIFISPLFHHMALNTFALFIPFYLVYFFFSSRFHSFYAMLFYILITSIITGIIFFIFINFYFEGLRNISSEWSTEGRTPNIIKYLLILIYSILLFYIYQNIRHSINSKKFFLFDILIMANLYLSIVVLFFINLGDAFVRISVVNNLLIAVCMSIIGANLIYMKKKIILKIIWIPLFIYFALAPNLMEVLNTKYCIPAWYGSDYCADGSLYGPIKN